MLQCRTCKFVGADIPEDFDLASLYGEDYCYGRGFDATALMNHPGFDGGSILMEYGISASNIEPSTWSSLSARAS